LPARLRPRAEDTPSVCEAAADRSRVSPAFRHREGAKPADPPIEQASKFELAVNVTGAKALGLTVAAAAVVG